MAGKIWSLVMMFLIIPLCITLTGGEREYLLNCSGGQLPSPRMIEKEDLSLSEKFVADFALTSEYAKEGKKRLKVTISKGGDENAPYGKCKFGITRPEKSDWSRWDMLRFSIYNPSDEIIGLGFSIRDASHPFSYGGRFDTSIMVPPGESEQEIYIQGIATNSGDPLNLKNVIEWYFNVAPVKDRPIILYFSDIELAMEE
jgi:hypothetical protein